MSADPITDDLRDHYSELSSGYGLWILGYDVPESQLRKEVRRQERGERPNGKVSP